MDIIADWNTIRTHFKDSFKSNFHVSIASVGLEGIPTVTPIGSLFLNDNQTGFYFEKYISQLPIHATENPNVCVLAVNSTTSFWLRSLFSVKFKKHPAIKLYGKLEERRQATEKEISRLNRRMKATKMFKGNAYLWREMSVIRPITFIKAEKMKLGKMTQHL